MNLPALRADDRVGGHHRLPTYARGKQGIVVGISPEYHYPDSSGHAMPDAHEKTYEVRFEAIGLADPALGAPTQMGVFTRC